MSETETIVESEQVEEISKVEEATEKTEIKVSFVQEISVQIKQENTAK